MFTNKVSVFGIAVALSMVSVVGQAAQVEVNWQTPEKYTDIRPANQSRSGFHKQVFAQLEKHLNKLAEALPDDQKLSITVTNVDLAGQVWPASFVGLSRAGGDIRVIKNIDIPRLHFSYTLTAADGTVLQGDEVELKDMSFLDRDLGIRKSDAFRYEKRMLSEWFDDAIGQSLASN